MAGTTRLLAQCSSIGAAVHDMRRAAGAFEADYMSKEQLQQPSPKQRRDALGRTGMQTAYSRLMRDD